MNQSILRVGIDVSKAQLDNSLSLDGNKMLSQI